ncbi:uncharacterized protein A4U43_C02F21000 [Asparagus officinalis]|uniref:protein-serine/threonine phosphatase n=1 Tax=Asparagus officinalis TaxID=4686 RepID=A0A5P1FK51_ASPOF|nr:probable protein phosphatase 2C 40 [Asparagus officinalis]ONK78648.1 uncharacterized protein A4U43_C02F21000 [Asparagus officinalis]
MLSRMFTECDGQLNVSFGYQCLGPRWKETNNAKEISTLEKDIKKQSNKSTFSCLSGAALSANVTLANTNICNGLIGTGLLPGLDSPKTFQRVPSSPSLSSADILSTSLQSNVSNLSNCSSPQSDDIEWDTTALRSMSAPSKTDGFLNAMEVQMAGGAAGEDRVQAVCSEENGWLFCAIYDGFNGRDAADFLAGSLYENIRINLNTLQNGEKEDGFRQSVLSCLQQALEQAENDFLYSVELAMDGRPDLVSIGSCVLVVLLYGQDLYTLSLGDSRAILATSEGITNGLMAVQLNDSHSIDNEVERSRFLSDHPNEPGTIIGGKVKGRLKLTRAFGVGYLKKKKLNDALMGILRVPKLVSPPYVSTQPSLCVHKVSEGDHFGIIASDGLFDFFSNEEAVNLVQYFILNSPSGNPAEFLVQQLVSKAAKNAGLTLEELMRVPAGRRREYHDDVTVIVILLGSNHRTATASTNQ